MRVAPVTILASSDAASDQTSSALSLNQDFSYSVAATMTSTPAGTLSLQASVDGVSYVEITSSPQVIADSGTTIWNVSGANYQYVKCLWVHTAGSAGTVVMKAFTRGF